MNTSTTTLTVSPTWVAQVSRHARRRPDDAALRFGGQTTTWGQLDDRSRRLATALAESGISAGDRVLLVLTNRPEFVEAFLAVNVLDAIAVPVNFRLSPGEVNFLAENSGARAVIVEQALLPLVAQLDNRETGAALLVVGGNVDSENIRSYDVAIATAVPHAGSGPTDLSRCAALMYTSGTTGAPKGAMLSYQNLLCQSITLTRAFNLIRQDEVVAVTTPMFHIAALGAVIPNLIFGYTTVVTPTGAFDADAFLELLEAERVTNAFLVPTQWQAVCASPTRARRDLRLHTISWGAAPATPALLRQMADAFPGIANVSVFGQTEMSPVTTVLDGDDALDRIGSVGKPVPFVEARIVDADMNDVPAGEVGEIVYRGPSTMLGYWNNPTETETAFRGGWFHSGDLVREDEDGFIYVVDRLKDMIISGGENVYCAEVEAVIADHPKVADVAVVGAPHDKWGETPVAVVIAQDPTDPPTEAELIAFTTTRIASYKKPTKVIVVDALPRNASGKVLKAPLRDVVNT